MNMELTHRQGNSRSRSRSILVRREIEITSSLWPGKENRLSTIPSGLYERLFSHRDMHILEHVKNDAMPIFDCFGVAKPE